MKPVHEPVDGPGEAEETHGLPLFGEEGPAHCRIWAVAGGKGGTGKSFVTSSLGLSLSSLGKRVVVLDADLGGPNLHTLLGVKRPGRTLSDFFDRKVPLNDLIVDTVHRGLGLVIGDVNTLDSNNITYTQKQKLFRHIRTLDADYLIIDLGSGAHNNIIDTFLLADRMIVVIVPEVTALENLFHFVKNAFFRKLKMSLKPGIYRDVVQKAWRERERLGFRDFRGLLEHLERNHPEIGGRLSAMLSDFTIHVILNRARGRGDIEVGTSVRSVLGKCFGFDALYVGWIENDDAISQCTNSRQPFVLVHPLSAGARQIRSINGRLMRREEVRP